MKIRRFITRAAMTLVLMLLTTATAWATTETVSDLSTINGKTLTPDLSSTLTVSADGNTYTIYNATGWGYFCDMLANGETFSGKTVRLGNDITVSRMAGSGDTPFSGTFDGQGNTLTLNYGSADSPVDAEFVAPFVFTQWNTTPTFRNLNIDGYIYSTYTCNNTESHSKHTGTGGLIGHLQGTVTIEHCTSNVEFTVTGEQNAGGFVGLCEHTVSFTDCVSSNVIHSAGGNNSGFVAWSRASGWNINFTGCLFNGKLLQVGGNGNSNGGFIGWTGSNKTVTITNSLCAPAALADGETMACSNSATFARGWNETATNSYYTAALGTAQGKAPLAVTAGENVTIESVSPVGNPVENGTYSVSGITAYTKGITRTVGQTTTFYYGQDDAVGLSLSNTATGAPLGYQYSEYTVSGGATLADGVLTLGSSDVTVSVDTSHPRSTGEAVSVGYVLADGTEQTAQAVALDGTEDDLEAGNYFVGMPTVSFDHTLNLTNGDVMLILADGCSMNIGTSASRFEGRGFDSWYGFNTTLTIYGQSLDEATAGNLNIYLNGSVIGIHVRKGYTQHSGNVTIDITGDSDRGIYALESTSAITINGGTLSVTADDYPAIWGEGTVNINGGKVDADGKYYGITAGGDITINGGIVNAKGSNYGIRTWSNGNIILGWTNATDRIYANGYNTENGTIAVASGKAFVTDDATPSVVSGTLSASAIAGKTLSPCLQLADDADNGATIGGFSGKAIAVQLQGRKLWKDEAWNTVCLPFALGNANAAAGHHFDGTPLEGADVRTLSSTSFEGGTLTLNFTPAEPTTNTIGYDPNTVLPVKSIEAGRPYIVKWAAQEPDYVENPVFTGVTVSTVTAPVETDWVDFVGTYSPVDIYTDEKTNLYLGSGNNLYYPWGDGMTSFYVNACRAYFQLKNGLTAGEKVAETRLVFGENEASGITTTDHTDSTDKPDAWYTLDGRKLDSKPAQKGVYIVNGRKVVIK